MIAIIGILIAMLLPAIQAARETARITQCKNNLKQIGLAWQNHHNAYKHFPTGGWGYFWTGDPDRGFDKLQPGGWAYNILPFIEETAVHDIGKGQTYPAKATTLVQQLQTPVKGFACPSRRSEFSSISRSQSARRRAVQYRRLHGQKSRPRRLRCQRRRGNVKSER